MKNYYAVLGVEKNASKEDIVKAYRKGAKTHHPDMNVGDDDAAKRFQEIQEAYDVLSDPTRRADYDAGGLGMKFRRRDAQGFSSPFGSPFQDIMRDFFGASQYRGKNMQIRLEIDLAEVYTGCRKEVSYKSPVKCEDCKGHGVSSADNCDLCKGSGFVTVSDAPFEFKQTCSACGGRGKINPVSCAKCSGTGTNGETVEKKIGVDVPRGVDSGMSIRLPGRGEESLNGGKPGDVIVYILVKDHPIYHREGIDLSLEIPVTYTQIALGCEIPVPALTGETITMRIPSGTQSHAQLKLRGKGLLLPSGVVGDMFVRLKVETPRNITDEHKELLEKLAAIEKATTMPRIEAWIKKTNPGNK
jgi:molecular chaperone DnaJ